TWRESELRSAPLPAPNQGGEGLARPGVGLPSLPPPPAGAGGRQLGGSDDLGTDTYREPLEVFLDACGTEADLTTFGRILISKMLASALANRIALHRWSVEHPEVRAERIDSPWIIVGLPP